MKTTKEQRKILKVQLAPAYEEMSTISYVVFDLISDIELLQKQNEIYRNALIWYCNFNIDKPKIKYDADTIMELITPGIRYKASDALKQAEEIE